MSRLLRNAMLASGLVVLAGACDSKSTSTTADQAGQSGAEVELAADIREAVVAVDSLSTNAKNVKIIVDERTVTLRGPVASADERATVERIAMNVAGTRRVINELELAP